MRLPKMIRKNSKERSPILTGSSGSGSSGSMSQRSSQLPSLPSSSVGSVGSVSLREINLEEEFEILKTLSKGSFSTIYLAKRASGGEKLVLKAFSSDLVSVEEFNRELNVTYFLSPHPNTLTSFNVSFIYNRSFLFVQELAPFGSLANFVKSPSNFDKTSTSKLPEKQVKLIAQQLASALQFMHELHLVHRDVTLDNVLVFKPNLSRVKLSDFGATRAQGTLVLLTESSQNQSSWATFAPPEICDLLPQEKYHCYSSSDVWQLGILIFKCLTGSGPWTCADITDPVYRNYTAWLRRKSLKMPEQLKPFSTRFLRLFKRLLEPKAGNRTEAREVMKYLKEDWVRARRTLTVAPAGKCPGRVATRGFDEGLLVNNSSIPKEDRSLKDFGLDTEIDKKRIEDWIADNTLSK